VGNNPNVMNNLKPFVKGDKRINRKGRPKSFGQLRELAQAIATETVGDGENKITLIDAIMRKWSTSKDPRLQQAFIEYAYGKVPNQQEVTGKDGEPIQIQRIEIVLPPEETNDDGS
jgi:hypothetical protein